MFGIRSKVLVVSLAVAIGLSLLTVVDDRLVVVHGEGHGAGGFHGGGHVGGGDHWGGGHPGRLPGSRFLMRTFLP